MLNYSCLRNKSFFEEFFEGDIIGTGFFHSVLLISMGLSFSDWEINFYSILPRAKKLNYFLPYFSLYVMAWFIFNLFPAFENCILSSNSFLHTCEQMVQFYYFWHDNFKKKVKKFLYHSFIYRNLIETNNRVHKSNETETFSSSPGNRILQSIRTFRESASNRTNTLHQELDCLRETLQIIWFVSRDSSPRKHRFENSSTRVSNLYIGESREIDFIWHYPGIKLKR